MKTFREYLLILTGQALSSKLKGKVYTSCEKNLFDFYGNETWPMKVKHGDKLNNYAHVDVRF